MVGQYSRREGVKMSGQRQFFHAIRREVNRQQRHAAAQLGLGHVPEQLRPNKPVPGGIQGDLSGKRPEHRARNRIPPRGAAATQALFRRRTIQSGD
jgi:hypothetical protein